MNFTITLCSLILSREETNSKGMCRGVTVLYHEDGYICRTHNEKKKEQIKKKTVAAYATYVVISAFAKCVTTCRVLFVFYIKQHSR